MDFTEGLRKRKNLILSSEPEAEHVSGIVLLPPLDDSVLDELAGCLRQSAVPVVAVALRRKDLGSGGAWRVLQAGAADLLVLDECSDPVEVVSARLLHIADVAELMNSALVKENLIGESRAWRGAVRQAVEVARFSTSSLLITGESGTGKELVARLVHTLDPRPDKGKLVVLDCTTVVPELSGSEFFGHERGAFTNAIVSREGAFALAHKGSLFLDEVGELPLRLQAELLRVVQEHTYKRVGSNLWHKADFRLICATNRDLRAEEARGNFRLDFFHRIACCRCHLPPLRERREDILPLARHFLRQALSGRADVDFSPDVQELLITRDYPGNARELRQLVERIARRHTGPGPVTLGAVPEEDRMTAAHALVQDWRDESFQNAIRRALAAGAGLQDIKELTVEAAIAIALRDAVGNNHRAAQKLGVTDRALQMRRASRRDAPPATGLRPPPRRHSTMDPETRSGPEQTVA